MRCHPVLLVLFVASSAHADILLLDVNDQSGERETVERIARSQDEDANIVVGVKTKDFLKILEMELGRAERGESDVETLVFSGHSGTGLDFYSEDKDRQILIGHLEELSKKYPQAFAQVRHVMLMGCLAGAKDDIASWSRLFPNVTIAAGFNGVGPSGTSAEKFLTNVLSEIERREEEAGGADALAALLADDQAAIDSWAQVLAGLDGVKRTDYGLDLCGSYHTRVKRSESTPQKIDRLLNEAFFACRDAERSCHDPRRKAGALRELFLLQEAHVRPRHPNPAFVDSQQRKIRRLQKYDAFIDGWLAANGSRLDAAAARLGKDGEAFPDSADFRAADRRAHVETARALAKAAHRRSDPELSALAAELELRIVQLRD